MSLADVLVPRLVGSGVVKQATPATAQGLIDSNPGGWEIQLEEGVYADQLHVWHSRKTILRLMPGCQIKGGPLKGYFGIHGQNPQLDILCEPGSLVRNPNGHGVGGSGGRILVSGMTAYECGASGFQFNGGGGQVLQVDRCDISNCGRELNLTTEPGYWRYGTHCGYGGGGDDYSQTRVVIVGNRLHDQHSGYCLEVGGQARGGVIAWNLLGPHDAAADPSQVGNARLGNGIQFYSSFGGSAGNLAVNNLARNLAGVMIGSDSTPGMATARNNVGWQLGLGLLHPTIGNGGGNVTRDLKTLQECLAAGLFDPAWVPPWVGQEPPPPPPPPPPPATLKVVSSIKNGAVLSGKVKWSATVTGGTAASVEFTIDGDPASRWTEKVAPYDYLGTGPPAGDLDTTKLQNGTHTLKVSADGKTDNVTVTVDNPVVPPPPTPQQQLLIDGWALEQQGTLWKAFKKANPGEAAKLEAYWAAGGVSPTVATQTGQALVKYAKARWT